MRLFVVVANDEDPATAAWLAEGREGGVGVSGVGRLADGCEPADVAGAVASALADVARDNDGEVPGARLVTVGAGEEGR